MTVVGEHERRLPEGDIYVVSDGSKKDSSSHYFKPFSWAAKIVKSMSRHKGAESVQARMGEAMGIAAVQLTENLYIISGSRLA